MRFDPGPFALALALALGAGLAHAQAPARPGGAAVQAIQPPPVAPRLRPAAGIQLGNQPRVLICVADGKQMIDIRRDYSSGTFGVYVNHSQSMTWLPNRNQVRMRFTRAAAGASGGVAPGTCAFQGSGVAPSEPDEVGFPIDPEAWQYGRVDGHPLLIPAGSHVDAMLTPGARTQFTVTLKADPQLTGSFFWGSETTPDVVP